MTVLSWLRINCQLVDFHRPTSADGRHPELFDWVLKYFEEIKQPPPLYLQHQGEFVTVISVAVRYFDNVDHSFAGHSRTIIGIEQRASGPTLLVLDPSHGPRQIAALGSSRDSLRLIRRNMTAMRAPQYQIVAIRGLIETEEQYQVRITSARQNCVCHFGIHFVYRLYPYSSRACQFVTINLFIISFISIGE